MRRTEVTAQQVNDAYLELNYLLSSWSNLQVNLFNVDLVSVPLVQGQATYSVDPSTIMMLDAYISYGSPTISRLIFPISRTDYASYPNKDQQGIVTVFWFDRLLAPTFTLWPVPDATSTYTLSYYRCYQNQDANLANGETPAIPYRWLDAMVAGLAHRLSRIYAPQLEQQRGVDAEKAWAIAATQDTENVPLQIMPGLSGYYYS